MKRNIVPVICPSERRETINVISVQLTIELGDLCYTFGSRVETDAISKVLNLKFWNLFLSKTIKHLICPHSFMQFFFSLFSSNKLDILFYSDIHHLHVNPLQSVPKQFCAMNMNALWVLINLFTHLFPGTILKLILELYVTALYWSL